MPNGWEELFSPRFAELAHLDAELAKIGPFYPFVYDVFNTYYFLRPENIRVVIIGQDPYHSSDNFNNPIAMGLSFSVRRGIDIPPSLKTVFKEIQEDLGIARPRHGDLTSWVFRGVFLLNTSLTVKPDEPKSHGDRWMTIVRPTLQHITVKSPKAIFLLWGAEAQKLKKYLGDARILEAGHPSTMNRTRPFAGCKHFSQVNNLLIKDGGEPIDWSLPA